jgi:NAD+ kinase
MLEVSSSKGGKIVSPFALNEVAILKSGLSSMITVEVTLNGEFLHSYKADGLLVATPTGSTAYNLSVGGPLLDPHVNAIILSPVATHSLNIRPLVVQDDSKIDLKISSRNGNYMVSVDGRSQVVNQDIQLHIERSSRTIKLVRVSGQTFMRSLKDKLNWGR